MNNKRKQLNLFTVRFVGKVQCQDIILISKQRTIWYIRFVSILDTRVVDFSLKFLVNSLQKLVK